MAQSLTTVGGTGLQGQHMDNVRKGVYTTGIGVVKPMVEQRRGLGGVEGILEAQMKALA